MLSLVKVFIITHDTNVWKQGRNTTRFSLLVEDFTMMLILRYLEKMSKNACWCSFFFFETFFSVCGFFGLFFLFFFK